MLFCLRVIGCGTVDGQVQWSEAPRLLVLCVICHYLPSTNNDGMLVVMLSLCHEKRHVGRQVQRWSSNLASPRT